jgi:carbonic anhydrase/acetyltransferase-like protein (isoleucine patch superfamily)
VAPKVHPSAWIADSADVIGDVELYISLAADYRAASAK